MHEPIVEGLEKYLRRSGERPAMPEFEAHLAACPDCRETVGLLQAQSALFDSLKAGREIDPSPGFYARVLDRIDAQREPSFWAALIEPAFAMRLALASLTFMLLLGTYMVTTPAPADESTVAAQQSERALAVTTAASFSDDPQAGRNAVLADLSYSNDETASLAPLEQ